MRPNWAKDATALSLAKWADGHSCRLWALRDVVTVMLPRLLPRTRLDKVLVVILGVDCGHRGMCYTLFKILLFYAIFCTNCFEICMYKIYNNVQTLVRATVDFINIVTLHESKWWSNQIKGIRIKYQLESLGSIQSDYSLVRTVAPTSTEIRTLWYFVSMTCDTRYTKLSIHKFHEEEGLSKYKHWYFDSHRIFYIDIILSLHSGNRCSLYHNLDSHVHKWN